MTTLSVVITGVGATPLIFDEASAKDIGNYVGEFVQQKCAVVVSGPWRVFFRPDVDGSRDEVVVEYGSVFNGPVAHLTQPYTATITRDGAQVYQVTIPRHFWTARWRWQSAPRPVVRTPDVLRKRAWIPNFGAVGLYGNAAVKSSIAWPGPMAPVPGIDPTMAAGGDHEQIGHLTEAGADYMIRPSVVTLASLRVEGEWMGNACLHWRNDDGTTFNAIAQQLRRVNDGGPGGTLLSVSAPASTPGAVYLDNAHMYPCANAGWMLTDDPYLLEELQFVVQWQIVYNAWTKRWGEFSFGQERALAWELRDAFLAAASTPAAVPSWLLPQSSFKAALSATLTRVMEYVNAPARIHALFRSIPRSDINDAWMGAFLKAAVGIGVAMGFSEWRPAFDWMIAQTVAMTDGKSGWNRQVPAPYEWYPNRTLITWGELQPATYDADTCLDWADCWAYMKAGAIPTDAPGTAAKPNYRISSSVGGVITGGTIDDSSWDGHTLMGGVAGLNTSYVGHVRAALAQAMTLGNAEAAPCYEYLNTEFPLYLRQRGTFGQARFSIDPLAPTSTNTGSNAMDINTVIADILTAQNDAYAVAGTPSLAAQLAAAQGQITTLTAQVAALQAKITAAQGDAAKVTTDLQ